MTPHLLVVGRFTFGERCAGTNYVLGLGKAFREIGAQVEYLPSDSTVTPREGTQFYDGFAFHPLERSCVTTGTLSFTASILGIRNATLHWLNGSRSQRYTHIITYEGSCGYLLRLQALRRRFGCRVINIVVEWYDPRNFSYRNPVAGLLAAADSELQRRFVNGRLRNNVCISSYLASYYGQRGCHTVRVPPLVDLQDDKWVSQQTVQRDNGQIVLAFAGGTDPKEDLPGALRGLAALEPSLRRRFVLRLMGASPAAFEQHLRRHVGLLGSLSEQVEVLGRLSHRETLHQLAQADASILLRPNSRVARAGFSTKFVESLSCGVPVIGNLTGDLSLYLHDGAEGVVAADDSPEAFADALRRFAAMPPDQRLVLRECARRQAERSFDYRHYVASLRNFLQTTV